MQISLIVAMADNGVIGKKGTLLPWHLASDLKRFKQITMGHPIIMGRTTYETLRQPLPGRQNIIITHDPNYRAEGCTVVHSIEDALQAAQNVAEVFIIGGAAVFEQTLPLASKIYLTRVHAAPGGDAFFHYDSRQWSEGNLEKHLADDKNDYDYTFSVLTRSQPDEQN